MPNSKKTVKTLLAKLKSDFHNYMFVENDNFSWSNGSATITHPALTAMPDIWQLLHEVAHAELGHTGYMRDVELVRMETAAWHHSATVIAPLYNLSIPTDFIEDALDTYRQWLHKRSLCPQCLQTGLQENQNTYSCLNCRCLWRVNEARLCNLRRFLGSNLASAAN